MRFILAISGNKRTKVFGHEGKNKLHFIVMLTAILKESFRFLSKEDILICLDLAEKYHKEDNMKNNK